MPIESPKAGQERIEEVAVCSSFHDHVDEKIIVNQFAGDDENVIIDIAVRLKAKKTLSPTILKENGYEHLVSLAKGDVIEIPQFIHYRLEKGKFKEIRCVIK